VNLSIHTARASRSLQTSRPPGDAERRAPPSLLVGHTLVELTHPLRSTLTYAVHTTPQLQHLNWDFLHVLHALASASLQ
jgi:hypothetical protein